MTIPQKQPVQSIGAQQGECREWGLPEEGRAFQAPTGHAGRCPSASWQPSCPPQYTPPHSAPAPGMLHAEGLTRTSNPRHPPPWHTPPLLPTSWSAHTRISVAAIGPDHPVWLKTTRKGSQYWVAGQTLKVRSKGIVFSPFAIGAPEKRSCWICSRASTTLSNTHRRLVRHLTGGQRMIDALGLVPVLALGGGVWSNIS